MNWDFLSLSCCQYFKVFPQDKNYKKFWFKNLNWHLWSEWLHLTKMNTLLQRSQFFVLTLLFSQSNCILICYNTLLNYVKIMQYNKNWNKIEAKVPDLIKAKLFNIAVTKAISLHKTVWFNQINTPLTKKKKDCSQMIAAATLAAQHSRMLQHGHTDSICPHLTKQPQQKPTPRLARHLVQGGHGAQTITGL